MVDEIQRSQGSVVAFKLSTLTLNGQSGPIRKSDKNGLGSVDLQTFIFQAHFSHGDMILICTATLSNKGVGKTSSLLNISCLIFS